MFEKIKYHPFHKIFPDKKPSEAKTAFFTAFNLSEKKHRPKNITSASRNGKELTTQYLSSLILGVPKKKALNKLLKDSKTCERNSYRLIKNNKKEAIQQMKSENSFRYLLLRQLVSSIINDNALYEDENEEKLYKETTIVLQNFAKKSTPVIKKVEKMDEGMSHAFLCKSNDTDEMEDYKQLDNTVISILENCFEKLKKCQPANKDYIGLIETLKIMFLSNKDRVNAIITTT